MPRIRKSPFASAAAALVGSVAVVSASPIAEQVVAPDGYASGLVMVKVKAGLAVGNDDGGLQQALTNLGAIQFNRASSADARDAVLVQELGLDRWYQVRISLKADPVAFAAAIARACPQVEIAEADPLGGLSDLTPNDPLFALQYPLQNTGQLAGTVNADINATAAWPISLGSPDVTIGFLDGGVAQHTELAGRILPGWSVVTQTGVIPDQCSSHGTHVMGIALAKGNNADGIAGVSWNSHGLPVVVVNGCTGSETWLADGLYWALDHGSDVVNMSVQYSVGSQYLRDAVLYGAGLDIPMVASTGNSNSAVAYPAKWPEVIAVAGTTQNDLRWASSNYGPEVDISAPANQVYSCVNGTSYSYKSGTSMSSPHVSGTIALMKSVFPGISSAQVRTALESTAHDIESAGFDNLTGWGRLDAAAAVLAAKALRPVADLDGDGVVAAGDLAILLGGYGACANCDCVADLNADCAVDGADLSLLLSDWTSP